MKTKIQTVLGEKAISELGFTLMHEHVFVGGPGIIHAYPELIKDGYPEKTGLGYKARLLEHLKAAKAEGVDTLLEPTTFDLGRDASLLREMSEQSGVNIIACTGWYKEPSKVTAALRTYPVDSFVEIFLRDMKVGMDGTDVKAAFLKTSAETAVLPADLETVHRACAIAAKEMDTFVVLHQGFEERSAYAQLAIMKDEGMDMNRVKVDHVLDGTDRDYVRWIAEQGAWLGCDRIPAWRNLGMIPTEMRYQNIKAIIDMGYADRILLGHDSTPITMVADSWKPNKAGLNGTCNTISYRWCKTHTIPALLELGVDEATLNRIMYENPARFFAGE